LFLAVGAMAIAVFMSVLDTVICNVALPTMSAQLQISPAESVWIVNAYQLAAIVVLLPLASLGDRIGYRRIYLLGLTIFTAASFFCANSHNLQELIASRAVQGIGAASISSVNVALIRMIYPKRMLGRGVGINAAIISFSAVTGPTIAALILSFGPWPWLFGINVPLGILSFVISYLALPKPLGGVTNKAPFDYLSACLNAGLFGMFFLGIDRLGHDGLSMAAVLMLCVAIVSGIVLWKREIKREFPLVPVDLLKRPIFMLSMLTSICAFIVQLLAFISLPFIFQDEYGMTPMQTGALITPWSLIIVFIAPLAGHLMTKYRAGLLGGIGLICLSLGMAALATMGRHPSSLDIAWRMMLCGFGFAMFQTPNNTTIVSASPANRAGSAGGMIGIARMSGQTLGAVLASITLMLSPHHAGPIALGMGAAFAAIAALFSFSRLLN